MLALRPGHCEVAVEGKGSCWVLAHGSQHASTVPVSSHSTEPKLLHPCVRLSLIYCDFKILFLKDLSFCFGPLLVLCTERSLGWAPATR